MKRYVPFLIIAAVGLVTATAATLLYRSKMQTPQTAAVAPMKTKPSADAPNPAEPNASDARHVRGPANAPVTLEIYGDFQCPPCAMATAAIDQLETEFGPKMRVIFYQFPLAMHAHALEAAMAAEAADMQGRFWEMHDQLYQYQSVWSRASKPALFFRTYAKTLGLDVERFSADTQSGMLQARILSEGNAGSARGVRNTPTIFINGAEVRGGFTESALRSAVQAALEGKK